MLRSKKSAIFTLILVFLAGIAVGLFVDQLVEKSKREKYRKPDNFLLHHFTKELELTPTQQDTLSSMLDRFSRDHNQIRKEMWRKLEEQRLEFNKAFKTILTDSQRVKFEQMNREWEEKRRNDRHRDGKRDDDRDRRDDKNRRQDDR